jgi:D-tyrosyl-tRNA(Tyr) deacylase
MRSVVQRVAQARVTVEGEVVGAIGRGLLALVGLVEGDGPEDVAWVEHKLKSLRIFEDEAGKMNRCVGDVGGSLLVVSQFTLAADIGKGARPSFIAAMAPDRARPMIDGFVASLRASGLAVETGRFGAHMAVELVNDGPVTLWLDSKARG